MVFIVELNCEYLIKKPLKFQVSWMRPLTGKYVQRPPFIRIFTAELAEIAEFFLFKQKIQ